ncbi:MAG TPA: hypothetical protein VHR35_17550 [Nocardioides sp.]|nr:hypothetical protein [Nocardioides sp.]
MSASTRTGFGRILVFVYGVFALAATARALVQLATEASKAPVAYSLSLFSGIVYIVATWALATDRRRVAMLTIGVELTGVLVIGSLSHPSDIDRASVWSDYGNGYGFVPLVLPFLGLWWLWRIGRRA